MKKICLFCLMLVFVLSVFSSEVFAGDNLFYSRIGIVENPDEVVTETYNFIGHNDNKWTVEFHLINNSSGYQWRSPKVYYLLDEHMQFGVAWETDSLGNDSIGPSARYFFLIGRTEAVFGVSTLFGDEKLVSSLKIRFWKDYRIYLDTNLAYINDGSQYFSWQPMEMGIKVGENIVVSLAPQIQYYDWGEPCFGAFGGLIWNF